MARVYNHRSKTESADELPEEQPLKPIVSISNDILLIFWIYAFHLKAAGPGPPAGRGASPVEIKNNNILKYPIHSI